VQQPGRCRGVGNTPAGHNHTSQPRNAHQHTDTHTTQIATHTSIRSTAHSSWLQQQPDHVRFPTPSAQLKIGCLPAQVGLCSKVPEGTGFAPMHASLPTRYKHSATSNGSPRWGPPITTTPAKTDQCACSRHAAHSCILLSCQEAVQEGSRMLPDPGTTHTVIHEYCCGALMATLSGTRNTTALTKSALSTGVSAVLSTAAQNGSEQDQILHKCGVGLVP